MTSREIRLVCTGRGSHSERAVGVLIDARQPGVEYDRDATVDVLRWLATRGFPMPDDVTVDKMMRDAKMRAERVGVKSGRGRKTNRGGWVAEKFDALMVTTNNKGRRVFEPRCPTCGISPRLSEDVVDRIADSGLTRVFDVSYC